MNEMDYVRRLGMINTRIDEIQKKLVYHENLKKGLHMDRTSLPGETEWNIALKDFYSARNKLVGSLSN